MFQIQQKIKNNPTYRKIGFARFEIFNFELGQAITPFYQADQVVKRFYNNDNKCFEVTIEEKRTMAKKVKCKNKAKELGINKDIEFKGFVSEEEKIANLQSVHALINTSYKFKYI